MRLNVLKRFKLSKPKLILLGTLALVVLLISTRPSKEPQQRQERAWAVEVIKATPRSLSPTLALFGQVQSPQNAELSAGIEAVVMDMPVRDGVSVQQDELLLRLDDRDAKLTLQQTEADLQEAAAQQKFARIRIDRSKQAYSKEQEVLAITLQRTERAEQLFGEGLLSEADSETARENLARQQLAVNQAELNVEENAAKLTELEARMARISASRDAAAIDLERTFIRAPFAGIISDLRVSEGGRVRVGDPLMRLQNPDAIEIRAQLPSRIARSVTQRLQEDAAISAVIEVDGLQIDGELLRVSGQTTLGSGGVDSFIGIKPGQGLAGLRLGSTVSVSLELPAEPDVIAVPGEAIYGSDRLYKLEDNRMRMIEVERVGEREYSDGRTEVLVRTVQLDKNDSVIVTKLANAANGLLVEPSQDSGDAASPSMLSNSPAPAAETGIKN